MTESRTKTISVSSRLIVQWEAFSTKLSCIVCSINCVSGNDCSTMSRADLARFVCKKGLRCLALLCPCSEGERSPTYISEERMFHDEGPNGKERADYRGLAATIPVKIPIKQYRWEVCGCCDAAAEFLRWDLVRGAVVGGLLRRRQAEMRIFLG